ncbi:hypothetical protein DOY81_008281 [Sarcophaga bullata]|nr:hypothetical protein DOY81_008281 [Sarcophaga bullata]
MKCSREKPLHLSSQKSVQAVFASTLFQNYCECHFIKSDAIYFFKICFRPARIFGCVDGTHVKIVAHKTELQHLYYDRKGFFSINALVVCDHTIKIQFINGKNSGATHGSMIFKMPSLKIYL